jgi:hypothetical protein
MLVAGLAMGLVTLALIVEASPFGVSWEAPRSTATPRGDGSNAVRTPAMTLTPTTVASPIVRPAAALAWDAKLLPARHAPITSVVATGSRLVLVGREDARPAVWYSDDAGSTWRRAAFDLGSTERIKAIIGPMGVSVHGDVLVGMAYDERADPWVTLLWVSSDAGASWQPTEAPAADFNLLGVDDGGFLGVSVGRDRPSGSSRSFWRSADGIVWQPLPEPVPRTLPVGGYAQTAGTQVYLLAFRDDGAPEDRHQPSVWTIAGGEGNGQKVVLSDDVGGVYSVQATAAGFYAAGYLGPLWEDHSAAVWYSADGLEWTELSVAHQSGSAAIATVSNGLGVLAAGWFDVPAWAISPAPGFVWFSPGGTEAFQAQNSGHLIIDIAAIPDGFVGVTDCSRMSDCLPVVIIGRAAEVTATPSPSPAPMPVPTQPSIAGGTPRPCGPDSLAGTLRFSEEGRAFVIDATRGTRVIAWPSDFYAARTEFGVGLFMDGRALVAFDGDDVSVRGEELGRDEFLACRDVEVVESAH